MPLLQFKRCLTFRNLYLNWDADINPLIRNGLSSCLLYWSVVEWMTKALVSQETELTFTCDKLHSTIVCLMTLSRSCSHGFALLLISIRSGQIKHYYSYISSNTCKTDFPIHEMATSMAFFVTRRKKKEEFLHFLLVLLACKAKTRALGNARPIRSISKNGCNHPPGGNIWSRWEIANIQKVQWKMIAANVAPPYWIHPVQSINVYIIKTN